jgi:Nucleotidyl transferase AbiEii toxin, Type IV TA system
LGFGPDDAQTLVGVFQSISRIAVDDGIVFDARSVTGSEIRKSAGYGGVRIDLRATLDGARMVLHIDLGFGDAVTPGAQAVNFPTLLADLPAPMLRAYPKATVVAEKLHAVTVLGMTNSRMKDFFDLWVLLQDTTLNNMDVQQAVQATFARRQTVVPDRLPLGLTPAFATDHAKQTQWRAFLKKNGLQASELATLIDVVATRAQECGFATSQSYPAANPIGGALNQTTPPAPHG